MRILFIGDIVGKTGRAVVKRLLPSLKEQYAIDFTIANGENATHGKGLSKDHYKELIDMGIDLITLGNHAFSKAEILEYIDSADRLIRPLNIEPLNKGRSYCKVTIHNQTVVIINLCGAVFMERTVSSPFLAMHNLLPILDDAIVIVDLHAEATSEKVAFAFQYKDICSAVVGTHTHVQTADERIIDGCAFISDVGMSGPFDSVIGRDIQEVLDRFNGLTVKHFTVSKAESMLCGVMIEIDDKNHRAIKIERIQIRP
jgi:metallophosphoesterase (TIGR00282 family)